MEAIPTIDLADDPARVITALAAACSEVGFFQVVGHGVERSAGDAAWRAARAFFDLPLADRMAVARRSEGDAYGYVPLQFETLNRSLGDTNDGADLKETFNVGPVDPLPRPIVDDGEAWAFAPTDWPAALPLMRPAWEAYFREMLALSTRLMRLFARALGLPEDHFDPCIDESPSALRAINYPHQDIEPPAGTLRAGAHTDYGTLTILRQDGAPGGLEVFDHDRDAWIPVPSVPDAFVVNLGDLMQQWTNDRWRSTLHRVVNPPRDVHRDTRRQSMAFFHNANYHAEIVCLPTCLAPGEQPHHDPVVAGPHLMTKYHRATAPSAGE